jgi:DNA-binding CsgD family transcriptional regulator
VIPWDLLTTARNELDAIVAQLGQARAHERTARFHHLLRTRQIGSEHGEHIADVIELSGGACIVHWLHDPISIGLYSSSLAMREALVLGGEVILSLVDASERTDHHMPRSTTRDGLSETERKVLIELSRGRSNLEIADHLGLALQTVKNCLRKAYRAIGANSRAQAALLVRDMNLTE